MTDRMQRIHEMATEEFTERWDCLEKAHEMPSEAAAIVAALLQVAIEVRVLQTYGLPDNSGE